MLSSLIQEDSSTTRGESKGMGSLLLKNESEEDEVAEEEEEVEVVFFGPLRADDMTGFT